MPDIGEGYSESGFHRQRRNLVVGSLALLFIQIAELRLEPRGTLLGWTFQVGRPNAVMLFLWVAVLYWLIRFHQYQRVRRPTELQQSAHAFMRELLLPRALESIVNGPPLIARDKPSLKDGESATLVPFNFGLRSIERSKIEANVIPAWEVEQADGNTRIEQGPEYRVEFRGRLLWASRIIGYAKACMLTPYFTEYILPYVLFGFATAIEVCRFITS